MSKSSSKEIHRSLLPPHGDAETLLWRQDVIFTVELGVNLHELDLAVEAVRYLAIFCHGGAGFLAYVECLIEGKRRHDRRT